MVYLWSLSGDPLIFMHGQAAWSGQTLTSPLETLAIGYGHTRDQQLQGRMDLGGLEFGVAAMAVLTTIASWRTLPAAYALLATVFCAIVLSSGSTVSVWRHLYLVFPLFVVLAQAGQRAPLVDRCYLAVALILSGLFIALVATGSAMVS
jgi:hypothetical protein